MAAELFHADGQAHRQTDIKTDGRTSMTKLTVALRDFANAPKNDIF